MKKVLKLTAKVLAVVLGASLVADAAGIFRCADAKGAVSYQHLPCFNGQAPVQMAPLNALGDGLRDSEREWLRSRPSEPRLRPSPEADRGDARQGRQRRQAQTCLKRHQQLSRIKRRLRRGYKPAAGEDLRRRRNEHSAYLRAFCS